jgi:cytidine deaminase
MKEDIAGVLIKEAQKSMRRAIASYSGFKVGAAILTAKGNIYGGCNIENPSLMLSICAEKVALVKALSEGERVFKAIAIVTGDGEYSTPCGSCRQLLTELAGNIDVYLASKKGIKKYSADDLLPHAFSKDFA